MGRQSLKNAQVHDRERQALAYLLQGETYDAIAQHLGFTTASGAWRAVQRAMRRTIQPAADEVRALHILRCERLLKGHWQAAINGDPLATDRVLRILEREARLLGLDAPIRLDVRQMVEQARQRHGLTVEESRVLFERITGFLAEQGATGAHWESGR